MPVIAISVVAFLAVIVTEVVGYRDAGGKQNHGKPTVLLGDVVDDGSSTDSLLAVTEAGTVGVDGDDENSDPDKENTAKEEQDYEFSKTHEEVIESIKAQEDAERSGEDDGDKGQSLISEANGDASCEINAQASGTPTKAEAGGPASSGAAPTEEASAKAGEPALSGAAPTDEASAKAGSGPAFDSGSASPPEGAALSGDGAKLQANLGNLDSKVDSLEVNEQERIDKGNRNVKRFRDFQKSLEAEVQTGFKKYGEEMSMKLEAAQHGAKESSLKLASKSPLHTDSAKNETPSALLEDLLGFYHNEISKINASLQEVELPLAF